MGNSLSSLKKFMIRTCVDSDYEYDVDDIECGFSEEYKEGIMNSSLDKSEHVIFLQSGDSNIQ